MAEQDLTGQHLKVYVIGQGPLETHRWRSPRSSFLSAEDEYVSPIEPPPQRNGAAPLGLRHVRTPAGYYIPTAPSVASRSKSR